MPFAPLPADLADDLRRSRAGGVLELGCGDGVFTGILREHGADPVTLDRRGAAAGASPMIRADALRPPLRGRFGVVVAANLTRHLWPAVEAAGPGCWRDLVAPDGCLWILEDEPLAEPPSARNYRDLQALLARLMPDDRGPLLPAAEFRRRRRAWRWPGRWRDGEGENRWPVDAGTVAAWLAAGSPEPGGEVDALIAALGRDGLSYGRSWWARWQWQDQS